MILLIIGVFIEYVLYLLLGKVRTAKVYCFLVINIKNWFNPFQAKPLYDANESNTSSGVVVLLCERHAFDA